MVLIYAVLWGIMGITHMYVSLSCSTSLQIQVVKVNLPDTQVHERIHSSF